MYAASNVNFRFSGYIVIVFYTVLCVYMFSFFLYLYILYIFNNNDNTSVWHIYFQPTT